jgi:hypothetical integral membrane protein (TIGR02206 family)
MAVRQFSAEHLAAITAMVLAAALCVWGERRHHGRWMVLVARGLALLILAGWAAEYINDAVRGTWSARHDLPLQLTDIASVVTALALWTGRARLVELCYLWALTATLQAVITPDLGHSFPNISYFTYFIYHDATVVAACLLVFGRRLYPPAGAIYRVYLATLAWTGIAGLGDAITGGNYMYLRSKPAHASLLSALGSWPWYIVVTAVAVAPALLCAAWAVARLVSCVDPDRPTPQHARA